MAKTYSLDPEHVLQDCDATVIGSGQNILVGYEYDRDSIIIVIKATPDDCLRAQPSSNGRSRILASTRGFIPLDVERRGVEGFEYIRGAKLSLNLILPKR
ncbi:hypothetical protein [Rhodoligotrophos defluvii]|uniref:hypothetical protein n=1 Tax=Rhodoligotrophos defluvii TaxID=2561934 RepID=UPI0010C9384E|nr:hypothetical protein [Rhodoligotrophos defluvii]